MSDESETEAPKAQDILARLKQMTEPLVASLDARLGGQVDKRVDKRVEESFKDRLTVIERAIGDLDRAVAELREKLDDKKGKKD
jgi:hypothetical protein